MIHLASFKSTHQSVHGAVNIGIRLLDRGPYSHTEIALGDPLGGLPVDSFSASGVDRGVRIKPILFNREKWDFVPLPWLRESDVRELAADLAGQGYDYAGVARFALPFLTREHPTRWFCSELAALAMGLDEPWRLSPNALHAIALTLHHMHQRGAV